MMDVPEGALTRRALSFVQGNGRRLACDRARRSAERWLEQGVDRGLVQRALDYEHRWGDLYLPPSLAYNGGPQYLGPDLLLGSWADGGYLEAGPARYSVSYDFLLGPDGVLGVGDVDFVPLYASVEGWIESLALESLLRGLATEVRRFTGPAVSGLDLSATRPVPGVSGLSDIWLMDDERVVFLCRGYSLLASVPADAFAVVYAGIPELEFNLDL
ncbi:hypothetical protein AB0J80_12265 [Actinoplanes sp. NPDC049548]|uniref:hypothetical protein n=1 Tax=Actinoplanes sp. NPDC049548 TaxID=3155152 RepID=UPI00342E0361